jgi:hypothetical protein
MYEWTEPYEDTYLQERIQQVMKVKRDLAAKGQVLVSTYEQLWLPVLGDLPDTTYLGQERYSSPYGDFGPLVSNPFHGALAFTPTPGAPLPDALTGTFFGVHLYLLVAAPPECRSAPGLRLQR